MGMGICSFLLVPFLLDDVDLMLFCRRSGLEVDTEWLMLLGCYLFLVFEQFQMPLMIAVKFRRSISRVNGSGSRYSNKSFGEHQT
jgi:hypothetical protein